MPTRISPSSAWCRSSRPSAIPGALPLLPAEEIETLRRWSRPPALPAEEACFHRLFEAQVERTPEAPALISGDEQISYRELDQRANQLARYLLECGLEPESRVGV